MRQASYDSRRYRYIKNLIFDGIINTYLERDMPILQIQTIEYYLPKPILSTKKREDYVVTIINKIIKFYEAIKWVDTSN